MDVTGRPTTWGHWNPAYLNANRTWSDERGVNSLQVCLTTTARLNSQTRGAHVVVHAIQILAFLSTAYATTGDELFKTAYETLTNATNQYHENLVQTPQLTDATILYGHCTFRAHDTDIACLAPHPSQLNAKIESPDDDNYSDDELTFLPYYEILTANVSGRCLWLVPNLCFHGITLDPQPSPLTPQEHPLTVPPRWHRWVAPGTLCGPTAATCGEPSTLP